MTSDILTTNAEILAQNGLSGIKTNVRKLHPIALCLTQISVGIGELRLWTQYRNSKTGRLMVIVRAHTDRDIRRFGGIYAPNPESGSIHAPDSDFERVLARLLVAMGCIDCRHMDPEGNFTTTGVVGYDATGLSAHSRMQIAQKIQRLLDVSSDGT